MALFTSPMKMSFERDDMRLAYASVDDSFHEKGDSSNIWTGTNRDTLSSVFVNFHCLFSVFLMRHSGYLWSGPFSLSSDIKKIVYCWLFTAWKIFFFMKDKLFVTKLSICTNFFSFSRRIFNFDSCSFERCWVHIIYTLRGKNYKKKCHTFHPSNVCLPNSCFVRMVFLQRIPLQEFLFSEVSVSGDVCYVKWLSVRSHQNLEAITAPHYCPPTMNHSSWSDAHVLCVAIVQLYTLHVGLLEEERCGSLFLNPFGKKEF